MPLDAVTISALTRELKMKLVGARIDKVQQPERDMLLLSVRGNGESLRLLLSAATGTARAGLTVNAYENPAEPPMFCMLMRKHLVGARIVSVDQPELEREITFTLDARDELGAVSRKTLVCELIGHSANIILVGEDGRIIDCIRRRDFAGNEERRMLPGMLYRLPPGQNKRPFFGIGDDELAALIIAADRGAPMDKWLMDSFSGISPLIARELAYRCGASYDALSAAVSAMRDTVRAGELEAWTVSVDGKLRDFSFMAIKQYGDRAELTHYDSFSAMLDAFYSARDKAERQRCLSHELIKTVRTLRDRQRRKLSSQQEELARSTGREEIKKEAGLITANMYRLKRGDSALVCEDFYDPACPTVTVVLDPLKTPQANAAALYREYNKLKAAEEHLTALIAEGEGKLDYLNSVLDELERAESERDISVIRGELVSAGFLRRKNGGKTERAKPLAPFKFVSDDGFEILVGRSNAQNDELTGKLARRTDYWLHVQKIHGSHVIIRCDGLEPPKSTLMQAASLAAYYSQGRESGKTAVDYTMVRNVRKPSGALPGKVIYTEYKTLLVSPDEALAERLKK